MVLISLTACSQAERDAEVARQSKLEKERNREEFRKSMYINGETINGCPVASLEVMSACEAEKGDADAKILRESLYKRK